MLGQWKHSQRTQTLLSDNHDVDYTQYQLLALRGVHTYKCVWPAIVFSNDFGKVAVETTFRSARDFPCSG